MVIGSPVLPQPRMIPIISETDTGIVIEDTMGNHISLRKPISDKWNQFFDDDGRLTSIQVKV